jgi:hypothetical protein
MLSMAGDRVLLSRLLAVGVAALVSVGVLASAPSQTAFPPSAPTTFADRVAALSEPGGYFDTDNLISNERTFLSVVPALRTAGVRGGVYLGVGPDQNFSYISAIRPTLAILIDIRRDNQLLHLLFKALFAESKTRVEYLAQLCGRRVPANTTVWHTRTVDQIADYVDRTPMQPGVVTELRGRLTRRLRTFGVPLSAADLETIARFHGRFIEDGLDLQFHSTGRAPQAAYPTFRDLVLGTDNTGRRASYLADEDAFQFVKSLQARDQIIPVVGDLSGTTAMAAVARFLRTERLTASLFYTSNVEYYLRGSQFSRFVQNVRQIPWASNAVIIRSHFSAGSSDSDLERVSDFLRP